MHNNEIKLFYLYNNCSKKFELIKKFNIYLKK